MCCRYRVLPALARLQHCSTAAAIITIATAGWKRLETSRLHEIHESKLPFVAHIKSIRSKPSNVSAHISGVTVFRVCRRHLMTLTPGAAGPVIGAVFPAPSAWFRLGPGLVHADPISQAAMASRVARRNWLHVPSLPSLLRQAELQACMCQDVGMMLHAGCTLSQICPQHMKGDQIGLNSKFTLIRFLQQKERSHL